MLVHVCKNILGSPSGLLVNIAEKKYTWTDSTQDSSWVFDLRFKAPKCLDTLLKCNATVIDVDLPIKYKTMLAAMHLDLGHVKLADMIDKEDYRQFVKKVVSGVEKTCPELDQNYYFNVYVATNYLLENLEKCCVDSDKINSYLSSETNANQVAVLQTFAEPEIVKYDRFKSRTGRLVTEAGPQMLLLRKEYRDIVTSRYSGGKIIYFDYSALESRIMLAEANRKVSEKDLYQQIAKHLFADNISRNQAKQIVLSLLYGISETTLSLQLGVQLSELRTVLDKLKLFFRRDILAEQIHSTDKNGYIKTHFGRYVQLDQTKDKEINTYFQSTGVDVAMLGFTQIVKYIRENKMLIHPLFVLHDALILDVHPSEFNKLEEIKMAGMSIPTFECKFPLHMEQINERK